LDPKIKGTHGWNASTITQIGVHMKILVTTWIKRETSRDEIHLGPGNWVKPLVRTKTNVHMENENLSEGTKRTQMVKRSFREKENPRVSPRSI
jgi:hypothetical protein